MQTIDLTGTSELSFTLNEKSSFDIELEKFEGTTPSDFPTGTWRMNIFNQGEETSLLMLNSSVGIEDGSGFSVSGNKMVIKRNAIQNVLPDGNYGFEIRCDFADGTNIFPFVGVIKIQKRVTGV
jgi:hypothetical protein